MESVVAMSELLLASPLDRTPTRCVETLYQSARSLVAVLGEVLDFPRLEGGVLSSSRLPFDLHDLIKSVGTVLQTQAGEKGLTGGIDIGANCPQFVVGDATRLRQILLTLIDTAVKFTGHGAVRLHAARALPVGKCWSGSISPIPVWA